MSHLMHRLTRTNYSTMKYPLSVDSVVHAGAAHRHYAYLVLFVLWYVCASPPGSC